MPIKEGDRKKVDYEYERNGMANVFCGIEPRVGRYFNEVTANRNGLNFSEFLSKISNEYPKAKKIQLVMDNLSTHSIKSLIRRFGHKKGKKIWKRFNVHFTPKHGSWLNQADLAIGMYARQCLGNDRIGSIENLRFRTTAWNRIINKRKTKIHWKFNKVKARKIFKYTVKQVGKN